MNTECFGCWIITSIIFMKMGFLRRDLNFDAIYDYLCDIFEEVHSDEE